MSPSCAASACLHLHLLSFSFTYPLRSVIQFVSPDHSCWCTVSVSCLDICSFLATLSLSLVSLPASLLRVLSVYCLSAICLGFPLPPSQVPHSSWFSFCFLVFRSSVLLSGGFVFLLLLLPGLFSPRCFGACLPSVLSPRFAWTDFSFSGCVGLVGSPFLSSLSHSVRGSPSSFCHSWSSLHRFFFRALLTRSNLRFPTRRGPPFGPSPFHLRFFIFFALLSRCFSFAYPSGFSELVSC